MTAPRNEIDRTFVPFMSSEATRRYIRAATSDDILSALWKDILARPVHQYRELTRLMNIMSTWPLSRSVTTASASSRDSNYDGWGQ